MLSTTPTKIVSASSEQIKELITYLGVAISCSFINYSIIVDSIKLYMFGDIKPFKSNMKNMFNNGFSAIALARCEVYEIHRAMINYKSATIDINAISNIIYSWYVYEEALIADLKVVCMDYLKRYFAGQPSKETQIEYLNKRIFNYRDYVNTMQKRIASMRKEKSGI